MLCLVLSLFSKHVFLLLGVSKVAKVSEAVDSNIRRRSDRFCFVLFFFFLRRATEDQIFGEKREDGKEKLLQSTVLVFHIHWASSRRFLRPFPSIHLKRGFNRDGNNSLQKPQDGDL